MEDVRNVRRYYSFCAFTFCDKGNSTNLYCLNSRAIRVVIGEGVCKKYIQTDTVHVAAFYYEFQVVDISRWSDVSLELEASLVLNKCWHENCKWQ